MPRLTFTCFVVFLATLSVLHAQDQRSKGKTKREKSTSEAPAGQRFTYKTSAGKPRELEVFFPPEHNPASSKVPGLILFHGGGWTGGNLGQFRRACAYFASRGLVCATAEYQMLRKADIGKLPKGETHKRVCITDAKSAIRWFKQKAPEFGIDPNRIITGGGSAGGHISVLATTNPGLNDPADPEDINTDVVAYLLFNPAFATNDHLDPEIDVLRYLKPSFAPAIAFFGDKDNWKEGWDVAYAKLRQLGNTTTEEHLAQGENHGFFNQDPWQTVTLIAADRFLVQHGLLKGEPSLKEPKTGERLLK